jgi:hypothetical protein
MWTNSKDKTMNCALNQNSFIRFNHNSTVSNPQSLQLAEWSDNPENLPYAKDNYSTILLQFFQ